MTIRNYALSIFSGILLILVFPQWNIKELAWFSLVPLLFAVRGKGAYQGFLLGSLAGFVFNLGLVYWVTVSMTTYGKLPMVLAVLVLCLFALYLSLFISVPVCCSCYVEKKQGIDSTITLPFFWIASEYTRSWFLTGFPWENFGYSQYQILPIIQMADITGVYGISFLLVMVNGAVFSLLDSLFVKKAVPYRKIAVAGMLLAASLGYGWLRLTDSEQERGAAVKAALVQGNISQDVKWDPAFLDETMKIYSRLTLDTVSQKPDLVIWPEAATPFNFQTEKTYQALVASVMGTTGAYLLLGSPAWERTAEGIEYFNSAFLVSPDGKIQGRYDKMHLVPYGEYVPLKQFFPFIEKMVVGIGDFSSGKEAKILHFPGGSFGTLICYEIIFPDLVRRFAKNGASFLVNITNDAWFGRTSAPYQHLSMAVLRAVENRRSIARAANTGISAFIDANGSIVQQTSLFTPASITGIIFKKAEKTFYTNYGDLFAWFCSGVSLLLIAVGYYRTKMSKYK
jgi:apolipoprotein N-acyltransferase